MYVCMYVCVCVYVCMSVCIYIRIKSKCVPSQQWCFSESPPPPVEWGLPNAETCTAAHPSLQLDRYKPPHQDATLARRPAALYTDRPSPLAAVWSTCSCKSIWALIYKSTLQRNYSNLVCRGAMSRRNVFRRFERLQWIQNIRNCSHGNTAAHSGRLETSATPDITFKVILNGE